MFRLALCTAALLGLGSLASAGELDRESAPKNTPTPAATAPTGGTELDQESPQPAHRYYGGWGYGHHRGWGYGGWGYRGFGYGGWGYGGFYRPYYSFAYSPAFYGASYYGGFYGGFGYRSFYSAPYFGGWYW